MSKWTPGPWSIDEDTRHGMSWNRHITAKGNQRICFMAHGYSGERDQANARLISLAPEMAEVLQELLEMAKYAHFDNGVTDGTGTINEAEHWYSIAADKASAILTKLEVWR